MRAFARRTFESQPELHPMRQSRLLNCAMSVALILVACVADSRPPEPLKGRIIQSLNGPWKHKSDPGSAGENAGWQRAAPQDAAEVALPTAWRARTSGIDWYWREFRVPKLWQT